MKLEQLRSKRIGVLGLGANNRALTEWLVRHGARHVTVFDEDPSVDRRGLTGVRWHVGVGAFDDLSDFEILLRNPWIRLDRPELVAARQAGVTLSSQTALFFRFSPARIIGVTGTKGKGTTSSLIHRMIDEEGTRHRAQGTSFGRSYLAGNIGRDPFEFLDELTAHDWVVLELSSFQLEDLEQSPHVAVVLSVGEDHLDRHRSVEDYRAAKSSIVRYQTSTDHVVVHADDPISQSFARLTPALRHSYSRQHPVDQGAYVDAARGEIRLASGGASRSIAPVSAVSLRGAHTLENVTAAAAAAAAVGVSPAALATTIRSFQGLPHRLERLATVDGVSYYNDSYATGPQPTCVAIEAFDEPLVLILGGQGKGADYTPIREALVRSTVRGVICYGREGRAFQALLRPALPVDVPVDVVEPFDAAVVAARRLAKTGDVVLLSPAATSYDQFRNATVRGERFTTLVRQFQRETEPSP
jgi:UDP-N-acetylmuramoylalanine--D-glutamate ligase